MESPERPKLKFLHSEDVMSPVKLEVFRRLSTDAIKSSLHPGQPGSLKSGRAEQSSMVITGYPFSSNAAWTFISFRGR
jgi:hypothetical protein